GASASWRATRSRWLTCHPGKKTQPAHPASTRIVPTRWSSGARSLALSPSPPHANASSTRPPATLSLFASPRSPASPHPQGLRRLAGRIFHLCLPLGLIRLEREQDSPRAVHHRSQPVGPEGSPHVRRRPALCPVSRHQEDYLRQGRTQFRQLCR